MAQSLDEGTSENTDKQMVEGEEENGSTSHSEEDEEENWQEGEQPGATHSDSSSSESNDSAGEHSRRKNKGEHRVSTKSKITSHVITAKVLANPTLRPNLQVKDTGLKRKRYH